MAIPADHADEVLAALRDARPDQPVTVHVFTPDGQPVGRWDAVYVSEVRDDAVDFADVTGQFIGCAELCMIGGVRLHNTGNFDPGSSP